MFAVLEALARLTSTIIEESIEDARHKMARGWSRYTQGSIIQTPQICHWATHTRTVKLLKTFLLGNRVSALAQFPLTAFHVYVCKLS